VIHWTFNDGGRAAAGFKGTTGDCAVRAIAIACEMPYVEAYALVNEHCAREVPSKSRRGKSAARTGIHTPVMHACMRGLGWRWVATVRPGDRSPRMHVTPEELPQGRVILRLSKHFAASLDGVIHDTEDCSRGGTRLVYGYWEKD
jgi:hypothetical protein